MADNGNDTILRRARRGYAGMWLALGLSGGIFALVQHEDRHLLDDIFGSETALAVGTDSVPEFQDPFVGSRPLGTPLAALGPRSRTLTSPLGRSGGAGIPTSTGPVADQLVPQNSGPTQPQGLAPQGSGPTTPGILPTGVGTPSGGDGGTSGGGSSGGNGFSIGPGGNFGGGGSISGPIANVEPTPIPPVVSPVPEPSQWAIMLIGFFLIGSALRWRPARKVSAS